MSVVSMFAFEVKFLPLIPSFNSTSDILQHLYIHDTQHPITTDAHIQRLADIANLNLHDVHQQLHDTIDYAVAKAPQHPSPLEVERTIESLGRSIDNGGRLHATLTRALGIPRAASPSKPFPALPHLTTPHALSSRREAVIVDHTYDAIERSLERFRDGLAAEDHIFVDASLRSKHKSAAFFGEVSGLQEVYTILDTAQEKLSGLRKNNAALRSSVSPDDIESDLTITPEQTNILDTISHAYTLDLVRSSQQLLRSHNFFHHIEDEGERAIQRQAVLEKHIDSIIHEVDIDKDPLRFATHWVTDKNAPEAHSFIAQLPEFQDADLTLDAKKKTLLDRAFLKLLQDQAYPLDALEHETRLILEQDQSFVARISKSLAPSVLVPACAMVAHLNAHRLPPIPVIRPLLASRVWIGSVLLMHGARAVKIIQGKPFDLTLAMSRPLTSRLAGKPALPQRALLSSLRNHLPESQQPLLHTGFEETLTHLRTPASLTDADFSITNAPAP
jgi:hypothetical protein